MSKTNPPAPPEVMGFEEAFRQERAGMGLLGKFHYLSTVSGGGYIGSWLSNRIRLHHGDVAAVEQELIKIPEPHAIGNLREYSQFLTPRAGLASADTWAAVVMIIRNIFLNWFIFAPLLLLIALGVLMYGTLVATTMPSATLPVLAAAALLLLISATRTCLNLPSHRPAGVTGPDAGHIGCRLVTPTLAWAALVPVALVPGAGNPDLLTRMADQVFLFALAGSALSLPLAWMIGAARPPGTSRPRDLLLWLTVSAIASGLAAAGVLLSGFANGAWQSIVLAVLGPLWLTLCTMIHASLFVALRRTGRSDLDADREWLARLSAVKLLPTLYWAGLSGAVIALPRAVFVDAGGIGAAITALTAALSTPVAVLGGKSAASTLSTLGASGNGKAMPLNRVIAIAAAVTVLVLLMTASAAATSLIYLVGQLAAGVTPEGLGRLLAELTVALPAALLLWFASERINVNRFSLQGFYRNRLVRAYLAAGRPNRARTPDPFTGFDADDNPRMHELRAGKMAAAPPAGAVRPRRLLPVINLTLNLVGGERLAWQQRQAESFTVTPLACGSGMLDLAHTRDNPKGAYVSSEVYGGPDTGSAQPGDGISLGTAMALSGAAVSPAMGYHSSPPTALLMTLFNARLGCWLPNPVGPDRHYLTHSGPTPALRPLLNELLGRANDHQRDIYLSDGGHFDNLGLYEMVKRGCRLVFISDAGCDPDGAYGDLGETIRKIRVDFGVDVEINPPLPLNGGKTVCTTGQIVYPNGAEPGWLIYLRPVLVGDLPVDLYNYSKANPAFPNDTTLDQWFNESQFESYRHLGRHLVQVMKEEAFGNEELGDILAAITALN